MTTNDPNERRPWRTDEEWTHLQSRLSASSGQIAAGRRIPLSRLLIAASLAISIPTLLLLLHRPVAPSAAPVEVKTFATRAGERSVVHLSDSSTITLAPATTVRVALAQGRRDVQLDGMADFHVVHNAARPFVVRAGDAITTDVGTTFVIRAYRGDSSIRVAVTEGAVSVQSHDSSTALTLGAGEVALVRGRTATKLLSSSAPLYSAWVDGGLSFDDVPLRDAIADLQRWFDVDIRLDGPIGDRRVSAVYNDPTLAAVLDALTTALDLSSTRHGRVITLYARERR